MDVREYIYTLTTGNIMISLHFISFTKKKNRKNDTTFGARL